MFIMAVSSHVGTCSDGQRRMAGPGEVAGSEEAHMKVWFINTVMFSPSSEHHMCPLYRY